MVNEGAPQDHLKTLERGHIYFFYRPPVEQNDPQDAEDIQRMSMVIHPYDTANYRLVHIGHGQLGERTASGASGGLSTAWPSGRRRRRRHCKEKPTEPKPAVNGINHPPALPARACTAYSP